MRASTPVSADDTPDNARLATALRQLTRALNDLGARSENGGSVETLDVPGLIGIASQVIQGLTQQVGNTKAQRDMLSSMNAAWFWFWDLAKGKIRIESAAATRGPRRHLDTASWCQLIHPDDKEAIEAIDKWHRLAEDNHEQIVRIRDVTGGWRSLRWQGTIVRRNTQGVGTYAVGVIHPECRHPTAVFAPDEGANSGNVDFLANISHEIRTPMTAILGAACLAMDSDDLREQKELAKTIRASTEALVELLGDTLEFARLQAGRGSIKREPFDLLGLVTESARLFSCDAHRKGLAVVIRSTPDFPARIIADPGHIRQILNNLLSNALKFTDHGEIEITVDLLPGDAAKAQASLQLGVRDTGIGIPADRHAQVFDAFTEVNTDTRTKYGGTGLGLSICKRLAQLMAGTLTLESLPGRGSLFRLCLEVGIADNKSTSLPATLNGTCVAISEDSLAQRAALVEMIVELGGMPLTFDACANIDEQLARANVSPAGVGAIMVNAARLTPDIVKVLVELRQRTSAPPERLILMLPHAESGLGDNRAIRKAGARLLSTPFSIRELKAALATNDEANFSLLNVDLPNGQSVARALRILLAEDNKTNREVIASLLRRAGHEVLEALDGQQAVELFQQEAFGLDMVLMDLQMPVMDGFEAAEAIRACEERRSWVISENWRTTPILALTADALKGMEQRCRDAGMNALLLKPSTPDTLLSAIANLVTASSTEANGAMPLPGHDSPPATDMVDLLLNAAATATVASGHPLLDIRVALAWVGNDPRQLQPLLRSFVSELPGFIGSMDTLVAHPGYDEIGRLAHRMKSSLEIVGAPSARARVEALQKAAESDNREQVERIWKTLKLDCLNLSCLMEEMLEIIAPPHRRRSYAPIASG